MCRAPWPGDKFVGERAVVTTGQNRRSGGGRPSMVEPSTQVSQTTDGDMDEELSD